MATNRYVNGKRTREYSAWKAMKSRCYSPSSRKDYKEKGITVCNRWLNSFDNFLDDMGECPEGYTLDRIDNNKGYCKDNCRWADYKTQSGNRGNFNKVFTYKGKSQVLKDWANELGIKYTTLYQRIFRSGLSFEESITEDPFDNLIEYKDEKKTLIEWHRSTGIPYQILIDRKRRGWSVERMFEQEIKI